jgi:hypothetical protein
VRAERSRRRRGRHLSTLLAASGRATGVGHDTEVTGLRQRSPRRTRSLLANQPGIAGR